MFSRCFVQGLRRARFAPPMSTRQFVNHQPIQPIYRYAGVQLGHRAYSSKTADEVVEELTELYGTAKDEFEIAMEETEKVSVYAQDDRNAAREELENLKTAFQHIVGGNDRELAEEVKRRVGHRIRELENAVVNMEEMAMHQD